MNSSMRRTFVAVSLGLAAGLAAAAPQPIEDFARMPQIRDVAISADGRYVVFITAADDGSVVMTYDAHSNGKFERVAASDPGRFDVEACGWANNERVICSLTGNIRGRKYAELPFFRTMSVDASGGNIKTLDVSAQKGNLFAGTTSMANYHEGGAANLNQGSPSNAPQQTNGLADVSGAELDRRSSVSSRPMGGTRTAFGVQRTDEVIDMLPDDHDRVLIQTNLERTSFPSVVSLNIYTGAREVRARSNPPIRQFLADGLGNVRLGWGVSGRLNASYFSRPASGGDWSPLSKLDGFSADRVLEPVGIAPTKNIAYAFGDFEGRRALWTIDLTDERAPEVLLKHGMVDLTTPLITSDRRFFGVRYDLDRPLVYYSDELLRDTVKQINAQFTSRFSMVVDMTADEKTLVLRSFSDVDEGTYYLFDREEKKLKRLGQAYPELKTDSIGTMRAINFKAADGTEIHGYLTTPSGVVAEKLPLVVLPHDGPDSRDTWQFSYLRTFLANRGYAVLQVNFRGSSGFGQAFTAAARRSWAGVAYSDITDGTRWVVTQGIADPKRICIAGTGFGGYAALLGAARNSDLYRCSISINGISDLPMLKVNASLFPAAEQAYLADQLGSDKAQLEKDSPSENAAAVGIPVLLVHGDLDWKVQIDQSKKMESALKKQKKDYKAVYIKGAGHELDRKSDRVTLLKEVEAFLQKNLGAGAT
ncbi:MAG TPA: prolyl oligopeptidase family serine peptidase [Steroidobacteraceae bacterium]|jgi:dipeptidyl aminopeptidase/acylaminoacyl peptidase|nr:prolyl oligopeptidase family serine peptidase [Steroidobacteraceae bacterium]